MTLLAISNLVTISEKNTTKDNQKKKKSRLTKDDEKKKISLCKYRFFFVLWLSFELLNETIYISIFSL